MFPKEFCEDFKKLIILEGGYSNEEGDPGGPTIMGLTKRDFPEAWKNGPPSVETIKAIFYSEFWIRGGSHNIQNANIRMELFEAGILCGPGRAGKFLQNAYNVLCRAKNLQELVVDGGVGPKTSAAVNDWCKNYGDTYARALYTQMNVEEALHFRSCKMPKFIVGWSSNRLGSGPVGWV